MIGAIAGPLRRSVNQHQQADNSIHNDAVATKYGFRGGTVAGSIHLELFPPLLIEAFGREWFERGTISMNFKNATTNEEPVRALVEHPSGPQVKAWIERDDGMLVGEGTASAGESSELTALQSLDLTRYASDDLRILSGIKAGDDIDGIDVEFSGDDQRRRKHVMTEPLDWYFGESPWGGPVASPASMVSLMYAHPARVIGANAGRAVGLFGAIELRNIDGPVFVDRPYRISGKILAVGQSPKTEYAWFESYADASGRRVAEMRMQMRWMKASSAHDS